MNLDDEKRSSVGRIVADLKKDRSESRADQLPVGALGGLLGEATKAPDPSTRDYGERYEYQSVLGEGGQGVVLKATDRILQREVALKAIRDKSTPMREEQLKREAIISGGLEHPNIPPTYDLGTDETGAPFFIMRKVVGHSLDEILKKNRADVNRGLPPSTSRFRLLAIFLQVCNAMDYAHAKGVLHLDLKPQNIKLGEYGEVFILDWGFAARKDEAPKFLGGTPIYIAPERLRKEAPDERADIYALGVLLYRLLTGERPYDLGEMSFKEYRKNFDNLEIIPPRNWDSTISAELNAIILKAMAKDRESRYHSVHHLAADLQRYLDGVPVTAYHAGPLFRGWKFVQRHSTICFLGAALVLALAGTAVISYQSQQAEAARVRIETARREAEALRARAQIPFDKAREALLGQSPRREEWARGLFSKAIAIDPNYPSAYLERGKLHMALNASHEALADFQQVTRLAPNMLMAYYYAGIIQMDEKDSTFRDLNAAERLFAAMQKIDRDNEYSNLGLARLHILSGRHREALALCDRIETRNPSLNEVHFLRGDIYDNRGKPYADPTKALHAYNQYLRTPADKAAAYANRGDLLFHQRQYKAALTDYNTALQLNPDHVWVLNNRGYLLYSQLKDPAAAMADFNHAQEVMPEYHWTYMNRGAVYEYLQRWGQAMDNYNWAQDLRPQDASVYQRQGMCLFRQNKFEAAEERLTRGLELARASLKPGLHFRLGLLAFAMGHPQRSLQAFKVAKNLDGALRYHAALLAFLSQLRLGQSPDPSELSTHAKAVLDKPWLQDMAKCYRGILMPGQVPLTSYPKEGLCFALTYIGYHHLLIGKNPQAAAQSWEKSVLEGSQLYNEYVLAQAELDRFSAKVP
ncbi:MAG: protein kinase domain-containing protein [Planctomycetota bacterium]